jgi:menaquinone-dependent protoporphyrinogen oxidase
MHKILVAYSTWAGSTRQIAEIIKNELMSYDFQITIQNIKDITSVANYQYLILGSSIHFERVTVDFRKFLSRFEKPISKIPTAFFVVSFNMIEDTEKTRLETMKWLRRSTDNYKSITPISIGLFAGAALTESEEFKKLNILVRKMIESMKSSMISQRGKSNFQDTEQIKLWVAEFVKTIT